MDDGIGRQVRRGDISCGESALGVWLLAHRYAAVPAIMAGWLSLGCTKVSAQVVMPRLLGSSSPARRYHSWQLLCSPEVPGASALPCCSRQRLQGAARLADGPLMQSSKHFRLWPGLPSRSCTQPAVLTSQNARGLVWYAGCSSRGTCLVLVAARGQTPLNRPCVLVSMAIAVQSAHHRKAQLKRSSTGTLGRKALYMGSLLNLYAMGKWSQAAFLPLQPLQRALCIRGGSYGGLGPAAWWACCQLAGRRQRVLCARRLLESCCIGASSTPGVGLWGWHVLCSQGFPAKIFT